jgi:hypothetical protein
MLVCKRDAGTGFPVLTEGGSSADEQAIMGWVLPVT